MNSLKNNRDLGNNNKIEGTLQVNKDIREGTHGVPQFTSQEHEETPDGMK